MYHIYGVFTKITEKIFYRERQTQRLYTYPRVQSVHTEIYKQKPTKTKGISKGKNKPNAYTLTQESRVSMAKYTSENLQKQKELVPESKYCLPNKQCL